MNPALRTFGELRRGDFAEQLDTELRALVDAVRSTGKKGTLTVKLTVGLASKGDEHTLKIADEISIKPPQPDRGETIMFATGDGQLSRKDPRQLEMETFKEVKIEKRQHKDLSA